MLLQKIFIPIASVKRTGPTTAPNKTVVVSWNKVKANNVQKNSKVAFLFSCSSEVIHKFSFLKVPK